MHTIDVPKRFRAPGEAKKNASKKWNSKNALSLKTKRLSKRLFDKAENIILKQRIFKLLLKRNRSKMKKMKILNQHEKNLFYIWILINKKLYFNVLQV